MLMENLFNRVGTSGPAAPLKQSLKTEIRSAKKENNNWFIQPSLIYSLIRLLSQSDELGAENGTVPGQDFKHR